MHERHKANSPLCRHPAAITMQNAAEERVYRTHTLPKTVLGTGDTSWSRSWSQHFRTITYLGGHAAELELLQVSLDRPSLKRQRKGGESGDNTTEHHAEQKKRRITLQHAQSTPSNLVHSYVYPRVSSGHAAEKGQITARELRPRPKHTAT